MAKIAYIVESVEEYIKWSDLKYAFVEWYNGDYNDKPPKGRDIKEYFETNVFKCKEKVVTSNKKSFRGWKGFKILNMEFEIGVESNKVDCWINWKFRLGNVGLQVLHIRLRENSGFWWEFRLEI